MPDFFAQDAVDASRFARTLLSRGYTQIAWSKMPEFGAEEYTFAARLSGEHFVIRYYDPEDPPGPVPVVTLKKDPTLCSECQGALIECRGLCHRCYQRWRYQNVPEVKVRRSLRGRRFREYE